MTCDCFAEIKASASGACFSPDRRYRYTLWRTWDASTAPLVVVLLNPSIADETDLDATLIRVNRRAHADGYGGFIVANAFALVSTKPEGLLVNLAASVGPENDGHLEQLAAIAGALVVGWGSNLEKPALKWRLQQLRQILGGRASCWGTTKAGSPRHPLYVPYKQALKPFLWTT